MAKKHHIFLIAFLCLGLSFNALSQQSNWLKISIPKTGIYKLTAKDISAKGFKIKDIDPSKVEFLSSEGNELPQIKGFNIDNSLTQIPTLFSGNKGKLGNKDYFLFYAEGSYENKENLNTHHYDKNNYVFVNLNGSARKEIEKHNTTSVNSEELTEVKYKHRFEVERYNLVNSGREWFGDFISSEYFQNLPIEGKSKNSPIQLRIRLVSTASSLNNMKLFAQNEAVGEIPLAISLYNRNDPYDRYNRVGNVVEKEFEINTESDKLNLRFELEKSQRSSDGAYLDWYEIEYAKKANFYNDQLLGTVNVKPGNTYTLNISGSGQVWDISNSLNPKVLDSNNPSFVASKESTSLSFFTEKNALTSPSIEKVEIADPNLKVVPDLLIVSPRAFYKAAESLAQYRRTSDSLNAQVVTVEDIYNYYSGGKMDPTAIRDFVKNTWNNDPAKLKYLLLFGDANFDFKNNRELSYIDNNYFIPAYQSRESLEPIYSFSSDDYFGFLENGMGEWPEGTSINNSYISSTDTTHKLNIGIGRLPIRNLVEAYDIVNKIINYETSKSTLGPWRNKITFVADDGDFNRHLRDAEQFSDQLKVLKSNLNIDKLYLDAFPQNATDLGFRSPDAAKALDNSIEQGTLIVNFNGHGSENGWTDEKLLTLDQIFRWKNKNRLPIFFTATCEYGRYDNPSKVSGAELSLLNKNNGAIALLTTTRPVFSSTNFRINKAFYEELENPENRRLGDIIKNTKNKSIAGVINRNFALLGDPALKIPKPERKVFVTQINGKSDSAVIFQQQKATFKGEVSDENFSGKIHGRFYDQVSNIETLGEASSKTAYEAYSNVLFEGITDVTSGKYEFEFYVPKNTITGEKTGTAYFYAVNADSTQEFVGKYEGYSILKSVETINQDQEGPIVSINTDNKATLSFIINDESGINLSTTGQRTAISLTINDTLTYELKNYYQALNGFKNGRIDFPLPLLGSGQHTIQLKLRDVYNNETLESFLLMNASEKLALSQELAFPNPASDIITFRFQHNKIGEDLEMYLKLFDFNGRVIASDNRQCYICDPIVEIGMNLEPYQLLNGAYFYQIVTSNLNSGETSKTGGKIIFWK
ncbi:Peptidase family C25 [Spirosomataceae bacterium TFI 002]|nr:Peptidase family C25 [Spirosomataceae bacterium TFI 002]